MTYLVISSHVDPAQIYLLDGDMVIMEDDLSQSQIILAVTSSLEEALYEATHCAFSPQTTVVQSTPGQLQLIGHYQFCAQEDTL